MRVTVLYLCVPDPCAHGRLRNDHGIENGVPVLLSTEKPRCKLVASEEVMAAPRDYQVRLPSAGLLFWGCTWVTKGFISALSLIAS